MEDAKWIKENGLRGGVLLPNISPDTKWVKPLYDPEYDRLWEVIEDLELPLNAHGGTGSPNYGKYAVTPLLMISEVGFYSQRPLVQFMLSGIFERFPKLKFVVTETGASWVPPLLNQLDAIVRNVKKGEIGELKYRAEDAIDKLPSEYFAQNVWMGVSQPGPDDAAVRTFLGEDRMMWGSDYPHDEGTGPYTTLHLRQVFSDVPEAQLRKVLAENPAKLYDFDLDKLAPLAEKYGPTVDEVSKPLTAADMPAEPNSALMKGSGTTIA
ncbi:MAG: amidohydrolase family protein [Acidimicrobiia bacterium]